MAEDEDRRLRELLAERAFTRLSAARGPDGAIAPAKIAEVAEIVARQVRVAGELRAGCVRIVATEAVRSAANAGALAAAIEQASGVPVEVLSAEEEARLAFAGAVATLSEPPAGELVVVDVGGGSTEIVAGTAAAGVTWSVSLPLGSSALTDRELPSDPPAASELARLGARIVAAFDALDVPSPAAAYAVGGSATSLRRLVGAVLGRDSMARALRVLTSGPAEQVAARLDLHPQRVRLLPAAILLLEGASRALHAPLRMAGGGLREGVVLEELRRQRGG